MEEAIELNTLGSAYSEFMEDRKEIIEEGYLGDVVMFSKVDYTIVGGKVVYKRTD